MCVLICPIVRSLTSTSSQKFSKNYSGIATPAAFVLNAMGSWVWPERLAPHALLLAHSFLLLQLLRRAVVEVSAAVEATAKRCCLQASTIRFVLQHWLFHLFARLLPFIYLVAVVPFFGYFLKPSRSVALAASICESNSPASTACRIVVSAAVNSVKSAHSTAFDFGINATF